MSARPKPWQWARLMRKEDLDAILEIEQESYGFPWSRGVFLDCLRMGYSAWVVTNEIGDIVGYTLMTLAVGEAHVLNICTSPRHRQHGVATFLLDHIIGIARYMDCESMLLEVRPSNTEAIELYHGFGFKRIGIRRSYYPARDGREDALLLSLAL